MEEGDQSTRGGDAVAARVERKRQRSKSSSSDSVSSSSSESSSSSSDNNRRRDKRRKRKKTRRSGRGKNRKLNQLIDVVSELQKQLASTSSGNYCSRPDEHIDLNISGELFEPDHQSEYHSDINSIPTESQPIDNMINKEPDFNFNVTTKVKEPSVPHASTEMLEQLKNVQHFDQPDWNSIRYADVQRVYLHSPGFVNLEPNEEIKRYDNSKYTTNMEKAFASITCALLKQRESLQADMQNFLIWAQQNVSSSYTDIHAKINETFAKGEYSKVSSDTMQLVCGHRAELIQHRREGILASVKDPFHKIALRKIPPSCSTLFDTEKFSSVLEKAGGVKKVFWPRDKDRNFAPQNDPSTSSQAPTQAPTQGFSSRIPTHQKSNFRQPQTKFNPNYNSSFRGRGGKPQYGRGGTSHRGKSNRTHSPPSRRDRRDQTKRRN